MSNELQQLADRIRNELAELKRVLDRVETGWQRAERSGDDYYLDGVALNLFELSCWLLPISWKRQSMIDHLSTTPSNLHPKVRAQTKNNNHANHAYQRPKNN